ncbi:MAG: hypothetical protein EPO68_06860 [Planctomycetota bacterium]|nr:MAG: hypothetical protein EPO68_06860 [Planctomycetota bacterium]
MKDARAVLPRELLDAFMAGHFGYGNLAAPVWFVGMEEHGGHREQEIALRLAAWSNLGRRVVSDVRDYHHAIGVDDHWVERPPIQPTWGRLIRVLLASKGLVPDTESVRAYQRDRLGRADGESCLLELMPLPAPGIGSWPYRQFSDNPALTAREAYIRHVLPARVAQLRALIHEHRPHTVVFYGTSYLAHWEAIADAKLAEIETGIRAGRAADTLFVAARHPAARGTSGAEFERVGAIVARGLTPG